MSRSLFAFQPWHSTVEMKRYMHLFFHEMPNMNTMAALERTRYTNFHSFILHLHLHSLHAALQHQPVSQQSQGRLARGA